MAYTSKVWFGCTSSKLLEYIDIYKGIRQHLIDRNCIVLFDWLEETEKAIRENPGGKRNIRNIYRQIQEAIYMSDFCIIENTIPNFSVTHQITHALSHKKPTLVLWQRKDNESFSDSYLEALDSPYLTIKEYTAEEYKKIIDEFLGVSRIEFGQNRYNVVLENKQKYYLDWASNKHKRSRSSIIREAIDKISAEDEEYNRHLSKK